MTSYLLPPLREGDTTPVIDREELKIKYRLEDLEIKAALGKRF